MKSLRYNDSLLNQQKKKDNIEIYNIQQEYIRKILNDTRNEGNVLSDVDGFPIVNTNKDNLWFASNVIFVFGKGAIFDSDDNRVFEEILSSFKNTIHGQSFLMNKYYIEEYTTSELLKSLEKQMRISHGNYHVVMFPIVLNDADVLNSPDDVLLKKVGVINKYTQWSTIEPVISNFITRYGLYTSPSNQPRSEMHPTVNESFNFDEAYDVDKVSEEVDKNLQRAATDYIRMPKELDKQRKNKPNLFSRIYNDTEVEDVLPEYAKGVLLRQEEAVYKENVKDDFPRYTLYTQENDPQAIPEFNFKTGRRKRRVVKKIVEE